MSLTKAQLRTRVLKIIDAESTTRWDITPNGEVDETIGEVQDKEWRRILSASPNYQLNRKSVTLQSDGTCAFTDLVNSSGDTQIRPYRILALAIDNIIYEEVRPEQYILPNLTGTPQPTYIWYLEGSTIRMFPNQSSSPAVIMYNYLPQRQELLSGEGVAINFIDGYEDVLAFEAGSRLVLKGGAEPDVSRFLAEQAEEMRVELLQDVMRRSTKPIAMRYSDDRTDWAG